MIRGGFSLCHTMSRCPPSDMPIVRKRSSSAECSGSGMVLDNGHPKPTLPHRNQCPRVIPDVWRLSVGIAVVFYMHLMHIDTYRIKGKCEVGDRSGPLPRHCAIGILGALGPEEDEPRPTRHRPHRRRMLRGSLAARLQTLPGAGAQVPGSSVPRVRREPATRCHPGRVSAERIAREAGANPSRRMVGGDTSTTTVAATRLVRLPARGCPRYHCEQLKRRGVPGGHPELAAGPT